MSDLAIRLVWLLLNLWKRNLSNSNKLGMSQFLKREEQNCHLTDSSPIHLNDKKIQLINLHVVQAILSLSYNITFWIFQLK